MPPAKCPYLHRCNKYAALTHKLDERDARIAAQDREIARLKAENAELKAAQCGGKPNPADVRIFGSSTPSSLIPIKANSTEESRSRVGGQPKGHKGHGRTRTRDEDVDEAIDLPRPTTCSKCGHAVTVCQTRTRDVVHMVPARRILRRYTVYRAWCPRCREFHESEIPGVMPNFAFSDSLIAQTLVDHYKNGIPMRTLARRAGVGKSGLLNMAHRIAEKLEPGAARLVADLRAAPVKHADETKWDCDGKSGYAWGFFTPDTSLYMCRDTRASRTPREAFGDGPHTGVLVVDRYAAYPGVYEGPIQFCLEHYKRNVRDLIESEPDNPEYRKCIPPFIDLLREAMTLRNRKRGKEYDDESIRIRDDILSLVSSPVNDGKLKGCFDLVREKPHRFFQWVRHPEVEAENNLAERRLRPLVTARKVCFGSQSEKGLRTREILMSIIDTLSLRNDDPVAKLAEVLDAMAKNPQADVDRLLWGEKKP